MKLLLSFLGLAVAVATVGAPAQAQEGHLGKIGPSSPHKEATP
jgi:hypothetical protein